MLNRISTYFYQRQRLVLLLLLVPPLAYMVVVYLGSLFSLLINSFYAIDDFSGGLTHAPTVRAEQLDAHRSLDIIKFSVFPGSRVGLENTLRGNEFGHHDICSMLFAKSTEHQIRDACHRGEIEGKSVMGEPGEHPPTLAKKGESEIGIPRFIRHCALRRGLTDPPRPL